MGTPHDLKNKLALITYGVTHGGAALHAPMHHHLAHTETIDGDINTRASSARPKVHLPPVLSSTADDGALSLVVSSAQRQSGLCRVPDRAEDGGVLYHQLPVQAGLRRP